MNPRFTLGLSLINQSRFEQADQVLRQGLAEAPNDPLLHSALALSLVRQKQFPAAIEESEAAMRLGTDVSFVHFVRAVVYEGTNQIPAAFDAIREAIRIDPWASSYYAALARMELREERWEASLQAAEQGLAIDPEDVDCSNIRAIALRRLGRLEDGHATLEEALRVAPEDDSAHANMGWAMLESGNSEQALVHFREALRLNPEGEWAREGLVEALKARHAIYRLFLYYFFWITRFSSAAQWKLIVGAYVGYQVLNAVSHQYPAIRPWVTPLLVLYVLWAAMTWLASPLSDLALFVHPVGRLALTPERRRIAAWVGVCLTGVAVGIAGYFWFQDFLGIQIALCVGLLIPSLSRYYECDEAWPRLALKFLIAELVLLMIGFFGLSAITQTSSQRVPEALSSLAFLAFCLTAFGAQFGAPYLAGVRPNRVIVSPGRPVHWVPGVQARRRTWLIGGLVIAVTSALLLLATAVSLWFSRGSEPASWNAIEFRSRCICVSRTSPSRN